MQVVPVAAFLLVVAAFAVDAFTPQTLMIALTAFELYPNSHFAPKFVSLEPDDIAPPTDERLKDGGVIATSI